MNNLQEVLFTDCARKENAHDKTNDLGEAANALVAYIALHNVIERAGLEDEYEKWLTSSSDKGGPA